MEEWNFPLKRVLRSLLGNLKICWGTIFVIQNGKWKLVHGVLDLHSGSKRGQKSSPNDRLPTHSSWSRVLRSTSNVVMLKLGWKDVAVVAGSRVALR